jgi:pyruvate dehydrogenase E1 component alpha subunit
MRTIATFEISYSRFIDPEGKAVETMPDFARDREMLVTLYRWMVLTRTFDTRAIALQRTGRLGTYASTVGQEAVNVGLAHAMKPEDVLLPSFREHGAQLVRGVTLKELFQYWGGDERGSDFAGPRNDFPVCIPVGTHAPHAAGVALAFKLRAEKRVAVCIFGDGATSKGDVYEAMNAAGAWALPVVFVVNNNQWAISVPRTAQTAAETLAQKAIAAGIQGLQVDGNDVIAVRQAVGHALDKARSGGGPTLIEALTYRLGDHTTVDDANRYRDDGEVGSHWKEEPIARTRIFLTEAHGWTREEEEALIGDCRAQVDAAAEEYLAEAPEGPGAVFDWLYEELPTVYVRQRAEMLAEE